MKKMLVLLILMLNTLVFCQSLTQAEKQEIINNLDSTKHWVREKAILDILEFNITEALPTLEQNIFTQEQDIASLYLKGLFQFNSTLSVSYAKKFIDTVGYLNGFPGSLYQSQDSFNVKYLKYEAASILFQKGDFSKAGIIISWIDFRYPKITALMPDQLSLILDIPQYELKAKNELIRISNSPSAEDYSAKAVKYLVNHFGNNIIPELLEIYSSNNYYVTRRYILGYLDNLNYPDYENF